MDLLRWVVLSATLGCWAGELHAQADAALTLPEVLQRVREAHPTLRAAEQKLRVAAAKRQAASGAWDPTLSVGYDERLAGYYEQRRLQAEVSQATPLWGARLHAGYRRGTGNFSSYESYQTLDGGELRAGVAVPLWRDGPIDENRAGVQRSELVRRAAECGVGATELSLQRQAALAYWDWVETGSLVTIHRSLLQVAEARDAGLRSQVQAGALPPIVTVDNARLVLDRRAKLVGAERDFREATVALSLFLRDGAGDPLDAPAARLPAAIPEPDGTTTTAVTDDVARALQTRPALCALRGQLRAAEVDRRLADNQVAPEVEVGGYIARDLGDGPVRLQGTEVGVGLQLEMPLLLRKARGTRAAADATVTGLDAELRYLRDRIGAEVRRARVDLEQAEQQAALTAEQMGVAEQLAEAERAQFEQGASDLVVVNLRELAAADAARQHVTALAAYQRARVDYRYATGEGW